MRRVLVSILAVLYLAMTGGVTFCAHYCMGEAHGTELSLFSNEEHACGSCGMTKKSEGNGCCKDEHKTLKLEQKHVPGTDVAAPLFAGFVALPLAHHGWEISRPFSTQAGHYTAACNGPPLPRSSATPIYLRVRNFRV